MKIHMIKALYILGVSTETLRTLYEGRRGEKGRDTRQ